MAMWCTGHCRAHTIQQWSVLEAAWEVSGRSGNVLAGNRREHSLYARCAENPSCNIRDYDLCSHGDSYNSVVGKFGK